MLSYCPKYYTDKAMYVYFALLLCVPVIFGYPMEWYFWIFGIVEVVGFFYFAHQLPIAWKNYSPKDFTKKLFTTALIIRIIYVIFSYWFYYEMTGTPFEFGAADVTFYDAMGRVGHELLSNWKFNLLYQYRITGNEIELSDSGYPIYLSFVYWVFNDSIFLTRILKAMWSAWTCVLVYKLASRNFGESVGRLSAIFCMLMPNLIYYCGIHLKETEMVFLIVLFAERVDFAICTKQVKWKALIIAFLIACYLFMFRTALGAVALIAFALTIILSSTKTVSLRRKIIVVVFLVITMFATVGEQLTREAEQLIVQSEDHQRNSMAWRAERKGGNEFAKYVGAAVFAPIIFTIPFPTLVNTEGQEIQRMINGGNYVKNITSAFTIFALFSLLFSGNWRRHVLIIAIGCGYLIVIALSAFAHSERFHLPALPFSLILATLGISQLQNKHKKWFNYWILFIFVANIAWAWFKLRGRGL